DVELLRDSTQVTAASIIDQVIQVTLLRVILPYMIGDAFGKLSQPAFMSMLAQKVPGGAALPGFIKDRLRSRGQGALKELFSKYDWTGKTWAALTKSRPKVPAEVVASTAGLLASPPGTGPLLAASSLFPDRPQHAELQDAGVTVFRDEAGSGL